MIEAPSEIEEGWGMTKRTDDTTGEVRLYISDGSNKIHIVDPETFKIIKSLEVFFLKQKLTFAFQVFDEDGKSLRGLNELEFVRGKLWANIFGSNYVAVIDPDTGLLEA